MPKHYQRGTPHDPLSFKWRLIIVSLLVTISTVLATASIHVENGSVQNVTAMTPLLAFAGAVTCLAGFIHDASMYALALQVLVFVATFCSELDNDDLQMNLAVAARSSMPIILVAILSMIVPSVFSIGTTILNPVILSSACTIPVLNYMFVYLLSWKSGAVTLSTTLIGSIALAALLLDLAWFFNRTHRHLNLLQPRERGIAVCTTAALILSIQTSSSNQSCLLPVLVGSTICTLLCTTLAATADVWNTVGTNQFWMVALDTTAMVFYISIPAILLTWRMWLRFGTLIYEVLHNAAQIVPGDAAEETQSLMLLLATATCFGIFYTKSLCPFGPHLFGRIYCCGMQNTKNVAVCMDWSDGKTLLPELKRLKASCSFVVTCENLKCDSTHLREAAQAGHTILPYTGERKAHVEYEKVFGHPPEWAHGESYPPDILACSKNGTKIVLWSSYALKVVKKDELRADIDAALGGNVICLEQVSNSTEIIEGLTKDGFTVAPLSTVLKEYKMVLNID